MRSSSSPRRFRRPASARARPLPIAHLVADFRPRRSAWRRGGRDCRRRTPGLVRGDRGPRGFARRLCGTRLQRRRRPADRRRHGGGGSRTGGAGLIALIGSDAQHLADALDVIGAAAGDGTLTPAGAVSLMVGIAAAGTQSQQATVGAALDNLVQAGTVDLGTVTGRLTTEVAAGSMAGADAVFVAMQLPHDTASTARSSASSTTCWRNSAVGQRRHRRHCGCETRSHPSYDGGNRCRRAGPAGAEPRTRTPVEAGHSAAIIIQAGAALVTLVEGDQGSVTSLIDQLAQQPYPAVPLLAAIERLPARNRSWGRALTRRCSPM